METEGGESVGELVRRMASATPGLDQQPAQDGTRLLLSGRPFVVIGRRSVAFRLRRDIASAGLPTPGASRSSEGPEWIALDADRRDRFSRDRAEAWFEFALRLAGG